MTIKHFVNEERKSEYIKKCRGSYVEFVCWILIYVVCIRAVYWTVLLHEGVAVACGEWAYIMFLFCSSYAK